MLTLSVTKYKEAVVKGQTGEYRVAGVLRGGWFYRNHFYYMKGLEYVPSQYQVLVLDDNGDGEFVVVSVADIEKEYQEDYFGLVEYHGFTFSEWLEWRGYESITN